MEEKCAIKFPVFDEVLHDSFVLTQCGSSDMFFFYACPCYHLITWVDHKYPCQGLTHLFYWASVWGTRSPIYRICTAGIYECIAADVGVTGMGFGNAMLNLGKPRPLITLFNS